MAAKTPESRAVAMDTVLDRKHYFAKRNPGVADVATKLAVSAPIVRRKTAVGQIPAAQLGRPGSSVRIGETPRSGAGSGVRGETNAAREG
jgi:hypothetical protein